MEEEEDKSSFESEIAKEYKRLMTSLSTCKPELNVFGTQLNLKDSIPKLLDS